MKISMRQVLTGIKVALGVWLKAADAKLVKVRPEEREALEKLKDVAESKLARKYNKKVDAPAEQPETPEEQ